MHYSKVSSLGKLISILYRRRNMFFDKKLQKYGITSAQMQVIHQIHHLIEDKKRTHVSQKHIAEAMHLDKATVTRSMKKLEKNGLVVRNRLEQDSREYNVSLTNKAQKLAEEVWSIRKRWTAVLEKGFSSEEKKTALKILDHMAANADEHLKGEK